MNIFQYIMSFFKPKTYVIAPVVTGGDIFYVPVIKMDGNWLPYLSKPYESQYINFDESNCVTQSGINCIEAILNYYLKNNLLPPEVDYAFEQLFCNEQGDVKLSTRFTSTMAGTTKLGLGMDKFWESVNRDGIVPLRNYPDLKGKFTWEDYYKPVPADLIAAGKQSAKIFQFAWKVFKNNQWNAPIIADLKSALAESPIHWAGASCPKDYAGITRPCGARVYQHARTIYAVTDYLEILDQFDPYLRKASLDYPVPCAIKAQLIIK